MFTIEQKRELAELLCRLPVWQTQQNRQAFVEAAIGEHPAISRDFTWEGIPRTIAHNLVKELDFYSDYRDSDGRQGICKIFDEVEHRSYHLNSQVNELLCRLKESLCRQYGLIALPPSSSGLSDGAGRSSTVTPTEAAKGTTGVPFWRRLRSPLLRVVSTALLSTVVIAWLAFWCEDIIEDDLRDKQLLVSEAQKAFEQDDLSGARINALKALRGRPEASSVLPHADVAFDVLERVTYRNRTALFLPTPGGRVIAVQFIPDLKGDRILLHRGRYLALLRSGRLLSWDAASGAELTVTERQDWREIERAWIARTGERLIGQRKDGTRAIWETDGQTQPQELGFGEREGRFHFNNSMDSILFLSNAGRLETWHLNRAHIESHFSQPMDNVIDIWLGGDAKPLMLSWSRIYGDVRNRETGRFLLKYRLNEDRWERQRGWPGWRGSVADLVFDSSDSHVLVLEEGEGPNRLHWIGLDDESATSTSKPIPFTADLERLLWASRDEGLAVARMKDGAPVLLDLAYGVVRWTGKATDAPVAVGPVVGSRVQVAVAEQDGVHVFSTSRVVMTAPNGPDSSEDSARGHRWLGPLQRLVREEDTDRYRFIGWNPLRNERFQCDRQEDEITRQIHGNLLETKVGKAPCTALTAGAPKGRTAFRTKPEPLGWSLDRVAHRLLIWGKGGRAELFDFTAQRPIEPGPPSQGTVTAAALSADGMAVVLATSESYWDHGNLTLWWPDNRHPPDTHKDAHPKAISRLAFSPTGSHLVSVSDDGAVLLWELDGKEGQGMSQLCRPGTAAASGNPPPSIIRSASFDLAGKRLVTIDDRGQIKIWALDNPCDKPERKIQVNQAVKDALLLTDGRLVLLDATGRLALWDIEAKREVFSEIVKPDDTTGRLEWYGDGILIRFDRTAAYIPVTSVSRAAFIRSETLRSLPRTAATGRDLEGRGRWDRFCVCHWLKEVFTP